MSTNNNNNHKNTQVLSLVQETVTIKGDDNYDQCPGPM